MGFNPGFKGLNTGRFMKKGQYCLEVIVSVIVKKKFNISPVFCEKGGNPQNTSFI